MAGSREAPRPFFCLPVTLMETALYFLGTCILIQAILGTLHSYFWYRRRYKGR